MRRSHSESSLFKKQKKEESKGKEKAKSTAAVSVATTTPVEPAALTLPTVVWEELLTRIPVLTELLATRVNRQLRDIIENLMQREYLKPAAELKTILANPENTKHLTIKNGLVDGSAVATFLTVPAARVDRLIACDRIGRLYLFNQEKKDHESEMAGWGDWENYSQFSVTAARGFFPLNTLATRALVAKSRINSNPTTPLSAYQRAFLTSPIVIEKISKGTLGIDQAINCCREEVIDQINAGLVLHDDGYHFRNCLRAGLTPLQIEDLYTNNRALYNDLSAIPESIQTLYRFAKIDFERLIAFDPDLRDFFLMGTTLETIYQIMGNNCNIDFQDVTALDPQKLRAILENHDNLVKLLEFGIPFSELAALDDARLKMICKETGNMFDTYRDNRENFDVYRPRSTSPGSLPIIHLDKLLVILDHARNISQWMHGHIPIEIIAQLDKKTIIAMAENVRIIEILYAARLNKTAHPSKETMTAKINLGIDEIFYVITNKQIPLIELLHLKDNEIRKFLNGLTKQGLGKTCDISISEHISFGQLAKLPREQLDIIRRDPKTASAQKILAVLRSPAVEEPTVSRAPTRRGSI